MILRATSPLLDAVWNAIDGTARPPGALRARSLAQVPEIVRAAGAAGWIALLEADTVLLAADIGVVEHAPGEVLRLLGATPQWFYRRASSNRSVAGREGITATDLAWVLILLERMGLDVDPSPLCQTLWPGFRDRTHLTEREVAIQWHPRERHRCEPLTLVAAELPQDGARLTHTHRTPSGYRAEYREAEGCGAPASITVTAPKWRLGRPPLAA